MANAAYMKCVAKSGKSHGDDLLAEAAHRNQRDPSKVTR